MSQLPSDWDPIFEAAARKYNVDPNLLRSIAVVESNGNPKAVSRAGAVGPMQLMPETWKALGVTDPTDPKQAIPAAAALMAQNLTRYGSPQAALMAYNGGTDPSKWNNPETQGYVPKIINAFKSFIIPSAEAKEPPQPSTNNGMSGADIRAMFDKQAVGNAPPQAQGGDNRSQDNGGASLPAVLQRLRGEQPGADGGVPAGSPAPQPNQPLTGADIRARFDKAQSVPPVEPTGASMSISDSSAPLSVKIPAPDNQDHSSALVDMGLQSSIDAAKQAYANTPPLVNPNGPLGQWMQAHGLGNVATTPFPFAADVNAIGAGALNAYQRGVMYLGNKLGMPLLARDIAALPEAMPGNSDIHPLPKAAEGAVEVENKLAPKVAPAPPAAPILTEDFKAAPFAPSYRAPEGAPAGEATTVAPTANPANRLAPSAASAETANKLAPEATAPPAEHAEAVATPGASATEPAPEAAQTAPAPTPAVTPAPDETITAQAPVAPPSARVQAAQKSQQEVDRFLAPAKEGRDETIYVPGTQPTAAEVEGNSETSIAQKSNRQANDQPYTERDRKNNQARIDYYESQMPTQEEVARMKDARSAQADKDLEAAFGNKQPTDAQPVVATIDGILNDPRLSELDAVQQYIKPIRDKLYDKDGNLKTDPESLYGIRENVAAMLSKASKAEKPTLGHVEMQLQTIKDALDQAIERGASGYKTYLDNYSSASRPIDAAELLQEWRSKIAPSGVITPAAFDRMMKAIVYDRAAPGIKTAKSLSDDQMNTLFNIQSDLKRMRNIDLGKPRGSDTNMLMNLTKRGAEMAAHGVAGYVAPAVGNLVVHQTANALRDRAIKRQTNKLLNPSIGTSTEIPTVVVRPGQSPSP